MTTDGAPVPAFYLIALVRCTAAEMLREINYEVDERDWLPIEPLEPVERPCGCCGHPLGTEIHASGNCIACQLWESGDAYMGRCQTCEERPGSARVVYQRVSSRVWLEAVVSMCDECHAAAPTVGDES